MKGKGSKTSKGNYYRFKTKRWFEDKGYYVEYLEKRQRIFSKGKVIFIGRDLMGCDGISMNGKHVVFWQSKLGRKHIAEAIKEFKKYPYPKSNAVDVWAIIWEPRKPEPEIIEVNF